MNTEKLKQRIGTEFRKLTTVHWYHAGFITSLLLLTMLVSWWAVFINKAIEESYQAKKSGAIQSLDTLALLMGHLSFEPEPGVANQDDRLEIIESTETSGVFSRQLLPKWSHYSLRIRSSFLENLSAQYETKKLMIFGESIFLMILILISGFMIYRMYWLERRTTQELHTLWSRVSHEIKTPITGLRAFFETLQKKTLSEEELKSLVGLALKYVDRQQNLAENMLVGQKLNRDGMGIDITDIELKSFFSNYLEDHVKYLSQIHDKFEYSLECENPVVVRGDREALKVICDNMVDNTVKYGGTRFSIAIEKNDLKGIIRFRDNGPGITPGSEEQIFKAYKRLKKELPAGPHGTGMGLYISRQLAEKMGADLYAGTNPENGGAEFILHMNLARTTEHA